MAYMKSYETKANMKSPRSKCFTFCVFTCAFAAATLLINGCGASTGIIGILGSPGRREKRVPAEFPLAGDTERRILVIVEQPGWLGTRENLRFYITNAVNAALRKKIDISSELIIEYSELSEFRAARSDISSLLPEQMGAALGADVVLLIALEACQLEQLADSPYHKGFLQARAALLDVETGEKLWPKDQYGRIVRVGFEAEHRGRQAAVKRLAGALAYCVTRYFYDCPVAKFRIAEDLSGAGWQDWDR